jgi:hypothetical protein
MQLSVPAEEIEWRSTFSRGPTKLPIRLDPLARRAGGPSSVENRESCIPPDERTDR